MNTQICRNAEGLVRNPRGERNLHREVAGAISRWLGLAWLALPLAAFAQIDYANETDVADKVRQMLYWRDADLANKTNTAFRYKDLLYINDGTSIRPNFTNMASLYGYKERTNAQQAEVHLQRGLTNHPASALLGNLLLDLYYDRATAEAVLAREAAEKAERAHFGAPVAGDAPPTGYIIDYEITAYASALQSNRVVLAAYLRLLTNTLGIVDGDPTPFGYRLFQRWVPERGLAPATYLTNSSEAAPVTGAGDLFAGYKDLVLLYDMLRDEGRTAATLAHLYLLRGNAGDAGLAEALITETKRDLFIHAHVLRTAFPPLPADVVAASGVGAALAGVSDSLAQLDHVKQNQRGGLNPLGFAEDFLFLVKKGAGVQDSFNVLRDYLNPLAQDPNPLQVAVAERDHLKTTHNTYREYQDEMAAQFDDSSITYMDRLRDIVGVFPDDPRYGLHPTNHPGGELDLQYREIELARLRIGRNSAEIDNLQQQVQIELGKAASISDVKIKYGNQQARLTEEISYINAAQAAANALAEAANAQTFWGGAAQVGNAMIQAAGEFNKGLLEGQKERTAALEAATIVGIEADATVKTLLLNMNLLTIDSQQAALQLKQEVNRLLGLFREKQDLEGKLAQRDSRLVRRYFADPVHRLGVQRDMIRTDLAFRQAQLWLFYMARALEYKWNKKSWVYTNVTYSTRTVFKLRNAQELSDFYTLMKSYNDTPDFSYTPTTLRDWFSVREHAFGFSRTNQAGLEAFRRQLQRLYDPVNKKLVIEFSTVLEMPGSSFFRGPRFDLGGALGSPGDFMDKLESVMINLPGQHSLGYTNLPGDLYYGGSSYLRNFSPGQLKTGAPDHLQNEWTTYATRYWFYDLNFDQWTSTEAQRASVTMLLSSGSGVEDARYYNLEFQERSVAASRWKLVIYTHAGTTPLLEIDKLDDIELYFVHHAMSRQMP